MEYNTLNWSKWWCQTETSHHAKEQLSKIYILSSYMVIYCLIKWRTKFPAQGTPRTTTTTTKMSKFYRNRQRFFLSVCVCVCVFRLAAASQSIEWTAASQQRCKSSFRMQPSEHTQSPCIKRCDRFEKSVCYFSSFGESQKPFLFIAATFCCCCCLCKTDEEKENPILLHI